MARVNDVRELDEQLSELVNWERFAVHLGMPMSDINIIDKDKFDTAKKKLAVYDRCLKSQACLTWETVVQVLDVIGENTLAKKVKLAKSICNKKDEKSSTGHSRVRVSSSITNKLDVLNKSFVGITENLKKIFEKSLKCGSITMEQIISRTIEERAFDFPNGIWQVTDTYSYFRVIHPFYTFLDCDLIVCLASLFVSSSVAVEANEYEKKRDIFMESTDIVDLHGALEVYLPQPQSLDESTSVRLTVVVQQSWGKQKLWRAKELIRFLLELGKNECQWFRVRSGSVVIDFLLPQRLIMFAIVQCVNKLEFLQLVGVIAIRVGTILVMRKTEDTKFSFQNSFIEACKLGKIKFVEFLLRFLQVNVNKPSENMFLQQKDTKLSFIPLLCELQVQFESIATSFMTAIIENEMIELSSLMSCVNEQRPSLASFFSSIANKSDFFSAAQCFINFLNVSFLVAIEKESIQLCSDVSFDLENYAERVESIKKAASISCLEQSVQSELQKKTAPSGTILACIVLSSEWRACSISIIEKLVLNIFSNLKSPDYLQWFEISSESNKIVAIFGFPKSFQKQLIKSSKENLGFMKSLGISVLKIGQEVVLQSNCDIFSFEKAFFEAKENNDVDVLTFLSEVQQDVLPMRTHWQGYFDENNNLTFECDPDSTALMISSAQGDLKLVKFLLDNGADPGIQSKTGATALLYAVYRGDYRIVQLLLEHNADLVLKCDIDNVSVLHTVCLLGNAKILKLLLQQNPDLNVRRSDGATPLFVSCIRFHVSLVQLLLKAQANPDIPDNNGTTPLSFAARAEYLSIVQCLLQANANLNLQDKFGATALFFAVRNNNFKMFQCLMDANADPCIETVIGFSAFHWACRSGLVKMVKQILKHKSPNISLINGMTPLYIACEAEQIAVVKLLIKAGANLNTLLQTDNGTITPLSKACTNGNLKMIDLLLKAKADPNLQGKQTLLPLLAAITINHPVIVDTLLKANADPNARSKNSVTPLMYACIEGHLEIVRSLLKANANPNVQAVDGSTPLGVTITTDRKHKSMSILNIYQIIDALLKAGADPGIGDSMNSTPLHMAASTGKTDIVARLLKANANPDIQTTEGATPLHNATYYAHVEVVKVLLKTKADLNILDYISGKAPLHIACTRNKGNLEIAQVLLGYADPNILDVQNNAPLHYASYTANNKLLQCLIASNDVNPNVQNQDGATPLYILCNHEASENNTLIRLIEMVNMLLKANADPNLHTSDEMLTPLHAACCMGRLQIVISLLKAKANPNVQNINGSTPLLSVLQICIQPEDTEQTIEELPNQYEIVDALLEAGADPNIVDCKNCTPLYIATIREKADIVARLLKGNADPNVQTASCGMRTPLHGACMYGFLEIVNSLLKAKADPNVKAANGATPLILLLSMDKGLDPADKYELVDALLEAQADPNIAKKGGVGCTPLYLAASTGKKDIVTRLLKGNANPDIQTTEGVTPLHNATYYAHVEVIKVLLKAKADLNILENLNGMAPLHIACKFESLEITQLILCQPNADPNILDSNKNTPLHYAVSKINPKILQCLIAANANPNIQNKKGFTPLYTLCVHRSLISEYKVLVAMNNMLLEANADPNVQTVHEMWAPLHLACFRGCLQIVNSLLKAKANPNIQDCNGCTPLVLMLDDSERDSTCLLEERPNQYDEVVDALLKGHADPNIPNNESDNPLILSASKGKLDIVARLLKANANPSIQNSNGSNPLHLATYYCHLEVVKVLLKEKANPNILDLTHKMAPLHIACSLHGSLEVAQVILNCPNTDPNILDGKKDAPIHYAVKCANIKLLQSLIASNANPNIRDSEGFTPLHIVCLQASFKKPGTESNTAIVLEMTEILLKAKADPDMGSSCGTPFQIAFAGENIHLQQLLFSHEILKQFSLFSYD